MRFASFAALALCLSTSAAYADPITYTVNNVFSNFSVTGTITTDGATGTISASDIKQFSLVSTVGSESFTINASNSGVGNFGVDAVSATATGLFFNYSEAGDLLFQLNGAGSGDEGICYQGAGHYCYSNGGLPSEGTFDNKLNLTYALQSGEVQIASVPAVASTPEPSSLVLLGTGLLGFAGMARKRFARS